MCDHLVSDGFDVTFGIILYVNYLLFEEEVLLVEFLEGSDCSINVIFIGVALRNEGDFSLGLSELHIHNGYNQININIR